jgi:hypothetical protein
VTDLVDLFVGRVRDGHIDIVDVGKLFEAFRSVGIDSVRVLFAREMERALRGLLQSGKLAALSSKSRKAKRK